jgi:hypothetical protein
MKNRFVLLPIILFLSIINLHSQTLNNTKWVVYEPSGELFYYIHFTNDTMYFSTNNLSYLVAGIFSENNNYFNINDLEGGSPCFNTTGNYTYLIKNDSLLFTLINDPCEARIYTFTVRHWITLTEGIENNNIVQADMSICPNPTNQFITIRSKASQSNATYTIKNEMGKVVMSGKVNESTIIDLSCMSKGIYFYNSNQKSARTFKIIKN